MLCNLPSTHYPLYDFDLRATHARTLRPAALAFVSFGFVLVRVRLQVTVIRYAHEPGATAVTDWLSIAFSTDWLSTDDLGQDGGERAQK